MKKMFVMIITVGLFCCSCIFLTGSTSAPNGIDQSEILNVISNADIVAVCPQKYINGTGNASTNTSASDNSSISSFEAAQTAVPFSELYDASQESMIVDEYTDVLHDYYTDSSWAIDAYSGSITAELQRNVISDTIDAGTLDNQMNSITPIDDNTLNVNVTLIGWIKCVDQQEDSENSFVSFVIVNRDTMTYHMKKEDDSWKIDSVTDHLKEFSPDDFDNGYGTYDTYEDAYNAISAFTVENPF